MSMFLIQSLILVAIAYVIGWFVGWFIHGAAGGSKADGAEDAMPAPAAAAPVTSGAFVLPPVTSDEPEDLKRIKGVGPQMEERLNEIGIIRFEQVAALTSDQQAILGDQISFPGRIERDGWVQQAQLLARGEETEFSKRVDQGEVDSSQ